MSGIRTVAITVGFLFTAAAAHSQNPSLNAIYQGADPKADFSFNWKEQAPGTFTKPVGKLRWEVPASEFSTGGMDRSFTGFCSEPLVPIVAGNTYRYEIQSPEMPEIYGLAGDDDGLRAASRRARYVREFFGRYYDGANKASDANAPLAFQAALWEIIHESEFPDVPAPFNLFTGNFQANYPNLAASPPYVQMAQGYLLALTGDDLATFHENTAIAGSELVHLKGIATEAGLVGQSQFGLRNSGAGGVPGLNGATAAGGTGLGGFGAPGGFFGGTGGFLPAAVGAGGGGGGGSGGGGSDITNPPTENPNNTPPPTTPPSTTPPTEGGGENPPEQPPVVTPNAPIPTPPAAVLGMIAVGVFAGRRYLRRFRERDLA